MGSLGRILVVDDEEINLEVMQKILAHDYEITTACSGEDALTAVTAVPPDLLLLDIMMPGIDGYEVSRRVRSDPELSHVRIILVSAKALTAERIAGYEAGADDYLIKPFDKQELLAKVRVFLSLKSEEEMNQMKSQLLNLVAHEIRTPLSGIIPAGELLMTQEWMDDSDRKMWGEMIFRDGHRLLSFAEKGLLLCQLKAEHVALHHLRLDLVDLINAIIRKVSFPARQKELRLQFHAPPSLEIHGDRGYLGMVLEFVLGNAIKYSPRRGLVRIALESGDDDVQLSITDSGPGIATEHLDRVFELFGARMMEGEAVGGGVNLALARAIVAAHGGHIWAESVPGKETTFIAILPIGRTFGGGPA